MRAGHAIGLLLPLAAGLTRTVQYAVPDKLSDETAAQFFVSPVWPLPSAPVISISGATVQVNPCTAYGMLAVLAAPKGEWVLQNAAGSVLGRQLTQIARHQVLLAS